MHWMNLAGAVDESPVVRRMKYRISATVTFLTCPCHIPILLFLLSGTAAGALLADNVWLVVAIVVPIFLHAAITAMLSFEHKSKDSG